ncbi:hypothetical protein BDQ17DRAFT_1336659 [Cyathus striatus]|nr:hypothetical protein BDQ17DRAFT_1336659 [Cyathus striatus]
MPGPPKAKKEAAAQAREAKARLRLGLLSEGHHPTPTVNTAEPDHESIDANGSESDSSTWDGTLFCIPVSDSEDSGAEGEWEDIQYLNDSSADTDLDADLEVLEGEELDTQELKKHAPYQLLLGNKSMHNWKVAEGKRNLGYNGLSDRRRREISQRLWEKEERDMVTRESAQANQFHSFFTLASKDATSSAGVHESTAASCADDTSMQIDVDMISNGEEAQNEVDILSNEDMICAGYLSDIPDDVSDTEDEWNDEDDTPDASECASQVHHPTSSSNIIPPLQHKRRKLEVPFHKL